MKKGYIVYVDKDGVEDHNEYYSFDGMYGHWNLVKDDATLFPPKEAEKRAHQLSQIYNATMMVCWVNTDYENYDRAMGVI